VDRAAWTPSWASSPGFAKSFLPWGRAPEGGRAVPVPGGGTRAAAIAQTKGEAFYRGEIAQALGRFMQENGGAHTVADLADFKPEWVKPIARDYRGHTLHEIPPNGQGIAALIALGILERFDVAACRSTAPIRSTCRSRP
jgi:gamma-glutamyltranspeptidase/glutathione hydrolase